MTWGTVAGAVFARSGANVEDILNARPGGIIQVNHPDDIYFMPAKKQDCEGCGAPYRAYTHQCDYCKRDRA